MTKRFLAYTLVCVLLMFTSLFAIGRDQPGWAGRAVAGMQEKSVSGGETGLADRFIEWVGAFMPQNALSGESVIKSEAVPADARKKNHDIKRL
jgi:hypothetical protein